MIKMAVNDTNSNPYEAHKMIEDLKAAGYTVKQVQLRNRKRHLWVQKKSILPAEKIMVDTSMIGPRE